MNRFERGMIRFRQRLQSGAGVTLTLTDLEGNSVTLNETSWPGMQAFRISDEGRSRVEWSDKDFLIPVNVCIIGGNLVKPERGYRITQTFDNPVGTRIYEIMAPEGEQAVRYSDPQNTIYRCHTKLISGN